MKFLLTLFILNLLFATNLQAAGGLIMLAGGGSEGDIGVTTDWSYPLYKKLVENGDTNHDGKIKVVVLSLEKPDTNFMVDYLKSMGADSSQNLVVSSRKAANDPKLIKILKDADVLFIRGGNQGKAYQWWKDTKLHQEIKALHERGGAIGGTSSGSMGLAHYSMTGGQDFTSKDILQDAHSTLLNDEKHMSESGIHNDFLNLATGMVVDTHCGERGRIGRLLAVQAKAIEDYGDKKIMGLCLEEKTGVVIQDGKAEVFGTGSVHFTQETDETQMKREAGKPVTFTNVRDDVLTEGWKFDLTNRAPDLSSAPKGTIVIPPQPQCGHIDSDFSVSGISNKKLSFDKSPHSEKVFVSNDAYSNERLESGDLKRGALQTYSLKALYDNTDSSIIMLDSDAELVRSGASEITSRKKKSADGKIKEVPSMIIDCQNCTHKSLSSFESNQDLGEKTLHSPALINMRVHLVSSDDFYNVKTHEAGLISEKENLNSVPRACKVEENKNLKNISTLEHDQEKILDKMLCGK